MIFYFPIEISIRDLQSYLFFASHAVNRGHEVIIMTPNDLYKLAKYRVLRKGVIIVKNVNVSSQSINFYEMLMRQGYDIYVHESEPSILWEDFDIFLKDYAIHSEQYFPFKGIFCWGTRDYLGYSKLFYRNKDKIHNTGSFRAELWDSKYNYLRENKPITTSNSFKVLFVSNFAFSFSKGNWTFWLNKAIENETVKSEDSFNNFLNFLSEDILISTEFLKAIRHLSSRYYDKICVIVRPHPLDDLIAWRTVLQGCSNIILDETKVDLSTLMHNSDIVIQNGCTSSIEAVIQNKYLVNYGTLRQYGNLLIPSKLGIRLNGISELDELFDAIFTDNFDYSSFQLSSDKILKSLITKKYNTPLLFIDIIERDSFQLVLTKLKSINIFLFLLYYGVVKYVIILFRIITRRPAKEKNVTLNRNKIKNEIKKICDQNKYIMPVVSVINEAILIKKR